MKKLLILFALVVPMIFGGCENRNKDTESKPLTVAQLDSIHHKEINDSINNLDTIKIMKVLFMGMTPEEYKNRSGQAILSLRMGRLQNWGLDTAMYHNVVHDIYLKSRDSQDAYELDDMKYKVLSGIDTFNEVVQALSAKYGKPSFKEPMSELNDNGFQSGLALWEFDRFNVEYTQKQWAKIKNNSHVIEGKIRYSIPRIQTKEEKQRTDSIVDAWEKERLEKEQFNNELKRNL